MTEPSRSYTRRALAWVRSLWSWESLFWAVIGVVGTTVLGFETNWWLALLVTGLACCAGGFVLATLKDLWRWMGWDRGN